MSALARHVAHGDVVWKLLKGVARYSYQTRAYGLEYKSRSLELDAYVDASYISEGVYSISGFIVRIGGNVISWKSSKQKTVALSSAESEINAMTDCIKEVVWTKGLLEEIGVQVNQIVIKEDNQAAIAMATNHVVNSRTRHIMAKMCYIRETLINEGITLEYCETGEMIADVLTKPLGRTLFKKFRTAMGVMDIHEGGALESGDSGFMNNADLTWNNSETLKQ